MAIELGSPQLKGSLRAPDSLRKTLGSPSRALSAAPEDKQLEHIKNLLKSMRGKESTQVVQQAQTITKSYTDIHGLYSEDGSLAANCNNRPPERRPALGRQRAKFSLKPKPVPSHSLSNIDFSSSIDHIDDPEEYFSAFEQLENAEKELKKLRGEVSTIVQPHQSTTVRKRRSGLLGKTASYKHHAAADPVTAKTLVESQEEHLDRRLPSLSNTSVNTGPCNLFHPEPVDKHGTSPAKNTNPELQDATVTEGSLAIKEKKASHLLDKLLSSFKDFDADEGKTFLRESLQMKSIDASKICLPELGIVQLSQRSASKNRVARGELNSSQISSPLAKCPMNAISTFQRCISLKDPLKDIYFSFPSDDAPSSGDYSLYKRIQRESLSPVDARNDDISGLLPDDASSPVVEKSTGLGFEDGSHSPVVEADMPIGNNIVLEEKLTKHPHQSLERKPNPDNGIVKDKGNIADGFDDALQEGHDIQLDPATDDQPDAGDEGPMLSCGNQSRKKEILDHPMQLLGENTNCDYDAGDKDKDSSSTFDGGMQAEGGYMQQDIITNQPESTSSCLNQTTTESLASPPSRIMGGNCSSSRTNTVTGFSGPDDTSQSKVDATVHEKALDSGMSKDIPCSPKETVHTDRHLENTCSLPDGNNEEHQTVSGPPPNEGRKRKTLPHNRNKKKPNSRRQSLAGAGMIWEDGRRKSTRRRFRPLEHWRGERLLYGRIHESLSTVIGVKYASPGKENFKVESYVSGQYADLVAQVSRC